MSSLFEPDFRIYFADRSLSGCFSQTTKKSVVPGPGTTDFYYSNSVECFVKLDCVPFYCSVSKAIWAEYNRM